MKSRFLLPLVLSLAAAAHAAIFERIVAKVNGEIITLSDYETRQLAAVQAANIPNERVPGFLREHGERILQDVIDEMLVYQKGEEMGIAARMSPEYLDKVIQDIKKENKIESDDVFKAQLAREGLTLEGLRRNIKRSIVRQQVIHLHVDSKIVVTDEELRKEYQRRRNEFTRPASVTLQEIVLKADAPEARDRATDLVRRARAGEDFAALAREHSSGGTRATGGDLGTVALAELHPELRKSIATAEKGYVTDPVSLAGTWRILKVNDREEARTVPYEEARETVTQRLRQERRETEIARFVDGLRSNAEIERRVRQAPVTTDVTVPTEPGLLRDSVTAPPPDLPAPPRSPSAPAAPSIGEDEVVVSPQQRPTKGGPVETPLTPTPAPTRTP